MKRKLCTVLILMAMALIGAMHWIDLSYYTDLSTGFTLQGEIWMRYIVLLVPLVMGLLGLRLVGSRAIGVLRVRHRGLAVLFVVAAAVALAYAAGQLTYALTNPQETLFWYRAILGVFLLVYTVWMALAARQLFWQRVPSPTRTAVPGIVAALPFCQIAVFRVLVNPSSPYRVDQLVRNLGALVTMLWLGMLLRAFYIALTRRRVRWMYLFGLFTFLFNTCLELPQTIHALLFRPASIAPLALMESIVMAIVGIVAGCVSVLISGQGEVKEGEVYYTQDA